MDEKRTPSEQYELHELTRLIHKANQLIAAGDEYAVIARQFFTAELDRIGSKHSEG